MQTTQQSIKQIDNITTQSDTSQTQWHSIDTHNYNNYSPFNGIMAAFWSLFGLAAAGGTAFGLLKWFPTPATTTVTDTTGDMQAIARDPAVGPDTQDYILIAAIGAMILAATACVVHHYALQDKDRARLNKYSKSLPNSEANITPKYNKEQSEEVGKTIVSTMDTVQEIISKANNTKVEKQIDPLENMMAL